MARLLFLASRDILSPEAAGGDITMHNVAARLAREGHEVQYVCSRLPGMARVEDHEGLRIKRVGNLFTTSPKFLLTEWKRLQDTADVVVEEVVGGLRVPYLSPWFADLPHICFWYQKNRPLFENQFGKIVGGILGGLEKRVTSLYRDAITLTPSEASKRDLIEMGLPGSRILVYQPGIDDALLHLAGPDGVAREPLLVTVGKFRRYKCLHHAIQILSRVHDRGLREVRLIIAGRREEDRYQQYMVALAEQLGVSSSVTIETDITERRKADIFRSAKLLLIPSPLEGFGRTAVEANLFGLPVLGTTGVPDDVIREGKTGHRLPFGDIDAFADVAVRLLLDGAEWMTISNGAREHAKDFTWDATLGTVRMALERLGL